MSLLQPTNRGQSRFWEVVFALYLKGEKKIYEMFSCLVEKKKRKSQRSDRSSGLALTFLVSNNLHSVLPRKNRLINTISAALLQLPGTLVI